VGDTNDHPVSGVNFRGKSRIALPVSASIYELILFRFPCVLTSDALWLFKRFTRKEFMVLATIIVVEWRARRDANSFWFEDMQYKTLSAAAGVAYDLILPFYLT